MLNVVIFHRLEEPYLEQIAAVSLEIRLLVAVSQERLPEARQQPTRFPPADIEEVLPEAQVLFTIRLPDDLLRKAPRLRWIHFATAGVERAAEAGLFNSPIILTTSSGIHAVSIGEHVMGCLIMFAHRFLGALRQQRDHIWKRYENAELRDKTLGIVGYGHIGQEVARLALAFGMKVIATKARVSPDLETGQVELLPATRLGDLLARSDYVVIAVPLTPETERLLGERELRAMKPTAILVNVSRGRVIDEAALIRALQEGWIAGAALDVFEKEPLPPDSPLWDMENVIVTPHIAGSHERYNERATALFCENLRRYLAGQPLLNLVDKKRGY